eukprot:scaffold45395_cov60-Phaeocystis_antarctica.AAC.3
MGNMFWVRSARAAARALAPSLESGPPRACRLRRRRPTPCRLPARTSLRVACPPFDSAECGGVQPAAEPRHVQRHGVRRHVPRAPRACPVAPSLQPGPPRAYRLRRRHPTRPPASRPAHLVPHIMHSFRLGRTQNPCLTPTSCTSVARGRATQPSTLLAMSRAGVREAARERKSARVLLERI